MDDFASTESQTDAASNIVVAPTPKVAPAPTSKVAPAWTRPDDLRPRSRRMIPFAFGAIAIGLSLTTGMLLAGEAATATTIVPVPVVSPVHVTTPVAPPAPVNVTVQAPAPAPIVAETPPAIEYRATTPKLDAECVAAVTADASDPVCTWDSGFPAISADGTQIVEHVVPDDGGRGNPGLTIVFTDAATSKVVKNVVVLSPDEVEYGAPIDDKLRAKIRRRVATAQKLIDAKEFRTLVSLGTSSWHDEVVTPEDRTGIHAEFVGQRMRLLDPATKTELWRHTFHAPSPFKNPSPDNDCENWGFASLSVWWAPSTRVVLGRIQYNHGGCMCGSSSIAQVFKL